MKSCLLHLTAPAEGPRRSRSLLPALDHRRHSLIVAHKRQHQHAHERLDCCGPSRPFASGPVSVHVLFAHSTVHPGWKIRVRWRTRLSFATVTMAAAEQRRSPERELNVPCSGSTAHPPNPCAAQGAKPVEFHVMGSVEPHRSPEPRSSTHQTWQHASIQHERMPSRRDLVMMSWFVERSVTVELISIWYVLHTRMPKKNDGGNEENL